MGIGRLQGAYPAAKCQKVKRCAILPAGPRSKGEKCAATPDVRARRFLRLRSLRRSLAALVMIQPLRGNYAARLTLAGFFCAVTARSPSPYALASPAVRRPFALGKIREARCRRNLSAPVLRCGRGGAVGRAVQVRNPSRATGDRRRTWRRSCARPGTIFPRTPRPR